jgi:hypothetical protein
MTRSRDVSQLTTAELELTIRQLRANLALITPSSPAHVPILAHIRAIDTELARRAGNPAQASALATNVHRLGYAALGFGRPQRCWRSLRMRARSRRWAASTSGWRAWALRQRR